MKTLYNFPKWGRLLFVLIGMVVLNSCSEDFPENIESSKMVVLKSIKILNAGADGSTVIEGVIDENKKTVSFPRVDPETDVSALQFEAVTSEGASLEKNTYAFPFDEGSDSRTITIKVINEPRYREYLVTLRLRVPVFGADFSKPNIIDHTNNDLGSPVYPEFTGMVTRGSGFDGEHVLVVTRKDKPVQPHLLSVADLKNNDINPIPLNMTGVSGGTYTINMGAQVNGHTYIANLSGGTAASPLNIYHWDDPSAAPQRIANLDLSTVSGSGGRHGDNMSVNLDENGNGYIFFGDNAGNKGLRLQVTGYTTISSPAAFAISPAAQAWATWTQVGNTGNYLYSSHSSPISVVNAGGTKSYTMGSTTIPIRSSDPRVFNFNGKRYLMATTAARAAGEPVVLSVYDISNGGDIVEALNIFEALPERNPVYEYSLLGPNNAAPSTQTAFDIIKDEEGNDQTLVLYTASTDAGFVIVEFPRMELDD